MNGAGKTTLIKLLCKLYKPTEGKILINDIDINDIDFLTIRNCISVVFQDVVNLNYTLQENITFENEVSDQIKYKNAIEYSCFDDVLEKYKEDDMYGKNLDEKGILLSGGEDQKLTIARGTYKSSKLIIMDEATASLDALTEARIYNNYNKIIKNRSAIIISHRLSTCRICDNILVLDKGKIIERDT